MIQIVALALVTAILAAGCETPKAAGIAEPLAVHVNPPKLEEAIEASKHNARSQRFDARPARGDAQG